MARLTSQVPQAQLHSCFSEVVLRIIWGLQIYFSETELFLRSDRLCYSSSFDPYPNACSLLITFVPVLPGVVE